MITIKEVAELAGVSKATVSRVVNDSGYVADETRKKINDIIKKYNYLPSASAVSLSRQETSIIGVVVPEIRNIFYADIVHGITEIADELNLSLVLFDTQNNLDREERAFKVLQQQRVKGIILGPSVDYSGDEQGQEILRHMTNLRVPIVIVDRDFDNMQWDAVLYENFQSSYRAAQELAKAGNREVAIINGDMNLKIARDRYKGFCKGVEETGLYMPKQNVLYGNFLLEKAYVLAKELLCREKLPDAVYTTNNQTTLGFLKAANECGVEIGKDIALLANDKIDLVDILGLNISCVYRDNFEMGRMALRLLSERVENPDRPRSICMIPYQVCIKGSEKKS